MNTTEEAPKTVTHTYWYFTFGSNHLDEQGNSLGGCFVPVLVPDEELADDGGWLYARQKMLAARDDQFCTQYPSAEEAGRDKWALTERTLGSVTLAHGPSERLAAVEAVVSRTEERLRKGLEFIEIFRAVLGRVPGSVLPKASVILDTLDFDHLTREEAVAVMTSVGAGRWAKSKNASSEIALDYTAQIEGATIRLWAAAPPGTCRVVEVEETIPAMPEQKVIRRKLVCSEHE